MVYNKQESTYHSKNKQGGVMMKENKAVNMYRSNKDKLNYKNTVKNLFNSLTKFIKDKFKTDDPFDKQDIEIEEDISPVWSGERDYNSYPPFAPVPTLSNCTCGSEAIFNYQRGYKGTISCGSGCLTLGGRPNITKLSEIWNKRNTDGLEIKQEILDFK